MTTGVTPCAGIDVQGFSPPCCWWRCAAAWAVRSSLGPSLVCAALSFLTYDFLFIPPRFSFA
ncbi:DUF4118 domain-containing protein, partial [Pseudomonas extremaustralis]